MNQLCEVEGVSMCFHAFKCLIEGFAQQLQSKKQDFQYQHLPKPGSPESDYPARVLWTLFHIPLSSL